MGVRHGDRRVVPITSVLTIITASQITGFTFPGMIDDPGCTAGGYSPSPVRGPDAIQRRSFAISSGLTATVFRAPLARRGRHAPPAA